MKSQTKKMNTANVKSFVFTEKGSVMRTFLGATLKEIMAAVHAECGSLFLFDQEHKELVLDSFFNTKELHIKGLRHRVGEGITGKVANIQSPVLVKDIKTDSRFNQNGFGHYHTNSFISVPISNRDSLIGLINLADKSNGEPFTEHDLKVVVTISQYACFAFDSINSYEQLKEEKEALNKEKALLEKYASVGKLAADVVHEVNNPLDGIIRYANILLEQAEEGSVMKEYLLQIKKGLARIGNTTNSLLKFSHQVNSINPQTAKYVNLTEIIKSSIELFSWRTNGQIKINTSFNHSKMEILDLGLQHVASNLIKNALDAMGETGSLNIATKIVDDYLELSFKDTGHGIPEEIMGRIFEPFFTTKVEGKGAGFGLSICQEIIGKYGGRIEVKSLPQGTNFIILISKQYLRNG